MNYPELENLIATVKKLRDPDGGCPWDLAQTHQSLTKNMLEECYEYIASVENSDDEHMQEEIGDVLLQVLLHATIAEQRNSFTIESVAKSLNDKLVHRHPHVFGNSEKAKNADQALANWSEMKDREKGKEKFKGIIDDSYVKFPALYSSFKIEKKAKKITQENRDAANLMDEVQQHLDLLKTSIKDSNNSVHDTIGGLLFVIAQLACEHKVDPEEALRSKNRSFINNFNSKNG